jgi:N,N'-diacetyllegionaminate synthase
MSDHNSVVVIAEAGVNHNGDTATALQLVDAAANAGADIVKFQTFQAHKLVTPSASVAKYQEKQFAEGKGSDNMQAGQSELLKALELSHDQHLLIKAHCDEAGIGFLSTAFDLDSLDYLRSIGISLFKIPSGEITNLPYLRRIATIADTVILSTGMSSLEEVKGALDILLSGSLTLDDVVILHCTTAYPTPLCEVNLLAMNSIKEAFGARVGYSDHTDGIEVAIAAVGLGASVIEKHLTLDRFMQGPDHFASIEPKEFNQMVSSIRAIEQALGNGHKNPTSTERENIHFVRKSIVASKRILKGERLDDDNLTAKRPASGISPMRWDDAVGSSAIRDFEMDELIEL